MANLMKIYGICDFSVTPRQPTNEDLNDAKKLGLAWPVLAILEGTHFVPDGASRNNRWYSTELWDKAINSPAVSRKMQNKTMFGRIGHEAEITEEDIAKGDFSHVTTDMALTKNGIPGYAKTYVLDTPMGRILNMLLRFGSKLYVSSRADGSFTDQVVNGCKVLDPDTYKLERFDFVVEPGFLQAEPKLVESLATSDLHLLDEAEKFAESVLKQEDTNAGKIDESVNQNPANPENNTPVTTFATEALMKENESLKAKLEESEKSQKAWLVKLMAFGMANAGKYKIDDFISKLEDEAKTKFSDEEKAEIKVAAKDANWIKEAYAPDPNAEPGAGIDGKSPSTKEDMVPEASQEDKDTLELVKQLGGIQAIKDALTFVDDYFARVGTPQQIESILDDFDKVFKKLGSPDEIEECLNKTNAFLKKNGTFESIEAALAEAKKSKNKKEELEKILDSLRKENESLKEGSSADLSALKAQVDKLKKENEAYKLSNETGVDYDKVLAKFEEGLDAPAVKYFFERATPENKMNESVNNSPNSESVKIQENNASKERFKNMFGWGKEED